jgi:uncharacterized Zn-finger protein
VADAAHNAADNSSDGATMAAPAPETPETIEVTTSRIACDGGGAAGHPRVWLQIDPDKGFVECGYCDRKYVLKAGAAREEH